MHELLIRYNAEDKQKVDAFDNMSQSEKSGVFWNNIDDNELQKLKNNIKKHYINKQDYTCPYCRQRIVVEHKSIWDAEHIIPKDTHPQFMFSPLNLCVSCKDCNQAKRNKNVLKNKSRKTLPTSDEDYIIIHPHLDKYSEHMKILKSSLFFIPLDNKGKETIEICGLLRFLYKFTDYGDVSLEVKQKISTLSNELLKAESGIEQNFILACIGDVVEQGKQIAQKEYIEKIMA